MRKLLDLLDYYKLDGYIIPKNDEFFNEYIDPSIDRLKYVSNFSGSAGFAIILKNKNYLFVDGRYTLQAKIQSGNKFKILTLPKKNPSYVLRKKLKIGFDPRLHTERGLKLIFYNTKTILKPIEINFIDKIWEKKRKLKAKKFYILKDKLVGQKAYKKINLITKFLKKNKADLHFITSSENISWLLNIRGNDSDFSPITNAYLLIDRNSKIYFFCKSGKINISFMRELGVKVNFLDLDKIKNFLSKIKNKKVFIDSLTCSLYYKYLIEKNNTVISNADPIYRLKSKKNKVEIKNMRESHLADGVALTKFLIWVKNNYERKRITEINAEKKLLKFRKENKNFKFLSFPTISGSGPNSSIIHYRADKKSNRVLKNGDLYLVDSGGQYYLGTTDVTRTLSLNNNKNYIKQIFTRVLKGHIAVSSYKIKKNTNGSIIDRQARKYLKEIKLDYPHGTGHGVGCFLNVHEGPQAISKFNKIKLEEGMVLSNEPGYYKDGKFGIRIENLITVVKKKNVLKFENLTLAPIDKSLINKSLMNNKEIEWLNNYHKKVFEKLKNYMSKKELVFLKSACSNI